MPLRQLAAQVLMDMRQTLHRNAIDRSILPLRARRGRGSISRTGGSSDSLDNRTAGRGIRTATAGQGRSSITTADFIAGRGSSTATAG